MTTIIKALPVVLYIATGSTLFDFMVINVDNKTTPQDAFNLRCKLL
jgi:hypothetical protein